MLSDILFITHAVQSIGPRIIRYGFPVSDKHRGHFKKTQWVPLALVVCKASIIYSISTGFSKVSSDIMPPSTYLFSCLTSELRTDVFFHGYCLLLEETLKIQKSSKSNKNTLYMSTEHYYNISQPLSEVTCTIKDLKQVNILFSEHEKLTAPRSRYFLRQQFNKKNSISSISLKKW